MTALPFVIAAADTNLTGAQDDLATAKAASCATASHLPLGHVRPCSRLLGTERKLLTHVIRMSAYNTESALARLIRPYDGLIRFTEGNLRDGIGGVLPGWAPHLT